MAGSFRTFVALGANLGARRATLASALAALGHGPGQRVRAVSRLYETRPVGPSRAPYLNAVAEVAWAATPEAMLAALLAIERAHGRTRHTRWGARTLDLDLVAIYDGSGRALTRDRPELTLPHPRAHERDFVLRPLCDLAPDLLLAGRPARAWLAALDPAAATIVRVVDGWPPAPGGAGTRA